MNYTEADLAEIDKAIAGGELSIERQGTRVTYRSMAELMQARRHIADQLEIGRGKQSGITTFFAQFDRD